MLDVPCGSGASALVAAAAVGPTGSVLACDLSERLLSLGRAKAAAASLANLEFRRRDMRALGLAAASFDAVVCVFGIFFVPDMEAQMRAFWRVLRRGGTLAVTTWGPGLLEPGKSAFWKAVGAVRPDLVRGFEPWEALTTPEEVRALYAAAGIEGAEAEPEEADQPLRSPDDWWTIVLGSGYRGTVEALGPDADRVRELTLASMEGARAVRAPAVYATARKR